MQADPEDERIVPVNVAQPVVAPVRDISPAAKVWTALHDCARFNSASVPVFAGTVAV